MNPNNTPMTAALARAVAIAVVSIASVGLTTYVTSGHDWYVTVGAVLASILTVLGGRGLVEGSVDTFRGASAMAGHTEHIHPSDVGAYAPSVTQAPAAPVVSPASVHNDPTGDYHPPTHNRD